MVEIHFVSDCPGKKGEQKPDYPLFKSYAYAKRSIEKRLAID